MGAVLETDALLVFADRVLATLVRWLRSQPSAQLYRRRRVVALDSDAGAVRLADGAVVQGDRVVVAAGAWSRRLLPDEASAHLTLNRQSVLYCRVPEQLRDAWAATPAMPALGTDDGAWLVPPAAGTPLKVSVASACRVVTEVAARETPRQWQDLLADRCSEVLAGFNRQWVLHSRDCYYLAETATGGPLAFDLAGTNVRVFAACGGTSFKFAPLIARSLAEYALGGPHRLQPAQTGRITSPCNEHGGLGIRIRC